MIGIYKITSPNGKVYIGQSIDIEKRFKQYSNINNSIKQKLLNRSFLKHGINNHKFEVLQGCEIDLLNELERYWQEYYNVLKDGLNCQYVNCKNKTGKLSENVKLKISLKMKGRNLTKEHKEKLSIKAKQLKNRIKTKHTNETKNKISNSLIGKLCLKDNGNAKIVLDINSNVFYYCLKEVSILYNINYSVLKNKLNGSKKNNTQFIYV